MTLSSDFLPISDIPHPTPTVSLLSREQALLEFNRRVLAQATRQDVPLLERLRYICIVSSNMDEFFEVRFSDALEASSLPGTGITRETLREATVDAHEIVAEQYRVFNEEVMPALARENIVILNHEQRTEAQRLWVEAFFHRQVRPLLVPVGLDPAHPFPQVANKSLNFVVKLGGKDAFGRNNHIAIVKVPRALPRVIRLPDELAPGKQAFVLLSSVVRAHLGELFPARTIEAFSQFRVTRDSDLDVDEEDATNLRQALRSSLSTRHYGAAIRLEVVKSCPPELSELLLKQFNLPAQALYRVNGPVNLVRLNQLIDAAHAPHLRFPVHEPSWPAALPRHGGMFNRIAKGDVIVHHPFESFQPVVELLREAVNDPKVLAIKQTIYRTGSESELMELLVEAARRGKEVLAVVELKARFDEEANINWADRLEAVGAQVVYGIVGLKTHAKMLLITRAEHGDFKRYLHLSTGNYNPKTARLYTDIGYFTANDVMAADADLIFQQLASLSRASEPQWLLQAPFNLRTHFIQQLEQLAQAAEQGKKPRFIAKMNALTDPELVKCLIRTAQAGVEIDLIVRGACVLPPGVPGFSDRIRVRSVVGRFLEHPRVLYFRWGDEPGDEALYLSSADWMSRNMDRRIEVAWPVRDPALRQRVIHECLNLYLEDQQDAWIQGPTGHYERVGHQGPSAQQILAAQYQS